jgi:hypothetical protein
MCAIPLQPHLQSAAVTLCPTIKFLPAINIAANFDTHSVLCRFCTATRRLDLQMCSFAASLCSVFAACPASSVASRLMLVFLQVLSALSEGNTLHSTGLISPASCRAMAVHLARSRL